MMKQADSYHTTKIITEKMACDSTFEGGDSKERLHMCEICGMRFGLLENLNRHRMIHTDQRPFPCNYCTKRFRLAQHLKEHIRIHTGEKPYKCPTCGRAFCQISNLKSHQKTHTKIKAFKCDICHKCFRRAFTLKQHKLTHAKRSLHGNVRASSDKNVPQRVYRTLDGKETANVQRMQFESAALRRHLLNCRSPNMASGGRFIASSPSHGLIGEFQVPATPSDNTQMPVSPSSAPPQSFVHSTGAATLKDKMCAATPSEVSQCPSLSALLRTNCDARMSTATSTKNAISTLSSTYYQPTENSRLSVIKNAEITTCDDRSQDKQERAGEVGQDRYSATDYSCVQCNERFANQTELQDHAIREHSRKNSRRDSAYSSHSDKSPNQSPNVAANVYPPVPFGQASEAPTLTLNKSHFTEDSFMKRVKELALISLGRYKDLQPPHTNRRISDEKERITDNPRSDRVKRERAISLEVGHSPTEAIKETNEEDMMRRESEHRDDEIKIIRRGFCGSKKWKRELCKEWYEVPQRTNQNEKSVKADNDMLGPQPKHPKEDDDSQASDNKVNDDDIKCNSNDPVESSSKSDKNQPSTSVSNFRRFVPIVEWKPVVTGWRDMVCGTIYALPPNAQHSYLQSMYDPRLAYSKSSTIDSSESSHLAEQEILDNETSPRYFRFSPHALANFHVDAESTPGSTGDSSSSGVYSYVYPPESLPLPGYSQLQHALFHHWDPNRQRLGGTSSSVPQTPNIISAT